MTVREILRNIGRSSSWRYLRRNRKFLLSVSIILVIIMLAVIGPSLTPYEPNKPAGPIGSPPSSKYIFGTDYFGYDVFAETVYGLRISLQAGLVGALVATLIGVLLGLIAGFRGGLVDSVIEIFTNIILAIPSLLIIILIITYVKARGIFELGLLVGIFSWPWTARAVRSQVAALKASDYVKISRLSGNSDAKILFKDILPNIASYTLLVFVIQLSGSILAITTLEFFGLGASQWSLGGILQLATLWGAVPLGMWWWFGFPGLILVALLASLYTLVASLEEVFNPALRRE